MCRCVQILTNKICSSFTCISVSEEIVHYIRTTFLRVIDFSYCLPNCGSSCSLLLAELYCAMSLQMLSVLVNGARLIDTIFSTSSCKSFKYSGPTFKIRYQPRRRGINIVWPFAAMRSAVVVFSAGRSTST